MRLILFFLLCVASRGALAEPIPPHLGEFAFTDYFSYYRSAGNYVNPGSSSNDLPNGGYFQTMQDVFSVNWDAFKELRFEANVGYGASTASNNAATITGQGFTEGSAGVQYWYRHPKWAIVPTAHIGFPFYRINNQTISDSLVSTPSVWGELGAWGIAYFKPWAIYLYGAYKYQDSGLAGLLPYDVGASYRFSFARVRVGVRGITTLAPDNDTPNPGQRNVVLDRVDNFSMRFYSVNPTVMEGYGEFDYLFMRELEAGIGAAQSFYGVNYSQGWTITAMVRFRLPGDWSSGEAPMSSQPSFEEKTERYDQHLFDQSNPDEINPKPKNIDKMLNDTEKQLEH